MQSLCRDGDARAQGLFALAIVRIGVKLEMQDATAVADRLCYEEFAETRSQARVGVTAMEARLLMADFFARPLAGQESVFSFGSWASGSRCPGVGSHQASRASV